MDGGGGHCLCGRIAFHFDGVPNWQAHCHCESCRRNCAAPMTSFFGIDHGKWRWTGDAPALYASSPGVRRYFCPHCGTPMAYESDRWPHERHFYAATLDDPSAFQPTEHVNWNEHLPWAAPADRLPRRYVPRRFEAGQDAQPLLALIRDSFAFMAGRIDPPSSADRLTAEDLAAEAQRSEIWLLEELGAPVACVILSARKGALYVGKLAVAATHRRQGLARQLIGHAVARAQALALPQLELQVRVELTENHAAFVAMGFRKVGESAHPGYHRSTSYTYALAV